MRCLAKYRGSKSISIARGTVNYKQADLNLVSVYLEDSDNIYINLLTMEKYQLAAIH